MTEYSYLSSSNRKTPAPQYQLDGQLLLSGKFEVPLFWCILFSPQDMSFPDFETEKKGKYWYINQPPYLVASKEAGLSRLKKRKKNLFKFLSTYQKELYEDFTDVISKAEYSYIHLYADQVTANFKSGVLKKHLSDLIHFFEKLESKPSTLDLLFSPVAYELGVNPKAFFPAHFAPKYFLRKFQHKYWEWKGTPIHIRDTYPLRDENSFVPPTQYNLVGSGEDIQTPWE